MKSGPFYHKIKEARPPGDFYTTPKSLIWVAEDIIKSEFPINEPILEPCFGDGAISDELEKYGYTVHKNDISCGKDYLASIFNEKYIITNPPFSLWNEFLIKAKKQCEKIMFIGRTNYFGTADRLKNGIWKNLKSVHHFNRYIDYRTPSRQDGQFHVAAMATAWFLFDMNFETNATLHFLDVQKYAKLGSLK